MSETIRCPRAECNHPINQHLSPDTAPGHLDPHFGCLASDCECRVDPNTIALAAVQTALFGGLTQPPKAPSGTWS